ncbi:MAG: 3-deoxy-8-phosphooctulonate synthase [Candidatus Cloacimonadaceae bacterium]|nr:3-deoxy-8-phosphooctulonate synthase [Candidatus Cloacimonadaceae bacterium]
MYKKLVEASPFFLIAGPCVIEDDDTMLRTAEFLKQTCAGMNIPLIFKSSYKKANRTAETSYTGPGLDEGLKILQRIGREFELPLISDIHETCEVKSVADVCDILQIPAFLSRQTALLHAAAQTGKIVNIKKGQFMAPEDMRAAAEKVSYMNNYNILLTERGTTFGYHNLVVDFRSFASLKALHYPVIYDVTHSMQRPSVNTTSGGTPEYAAMMAAAAIATGMVNGLFIETHPNPIEALSDAASMLSLNQLPELLSRCLRIGNILGDTNAI